MLSHLDLVKLVDTCPYPWEASYGTFMSTLYTLLSHDGTFRLGYVTKPMVDLMYTNPNVFVVDDAERTIQLALSLDSFELRTAALNAAALEWREADKLDLRHGWRNEHYTIYDPEHTPYFCLERAACPWFGVVMYGVHITGYVRNDAGLYIWVPRRSYSKPTYPGKLDNTVAGGLGYPHGVMETCYKECWEEAGLEESYTKSRLTSVGVISYLYQFQGTTVQPEVEYVFDLDMSDGKVPHPVDNEAMDFQLMSVDQVLERLANDEFKHNCSSVIIDFLIRHGYITPASEKNYTEINARLHRFLEFPLR